jgi:hypothetical protein
MDTAKEIQEAFAETSPFLSEDEGDLDEKREAAKLEESEHTRDGDPEWVKRADREDVDGAIIGGEAREF